MRMHNVCSNQHRFCKILGIQDVCPAMCDKCNATTIAIKPGMDPRDNFAYEYAEYMAAEFSVLLVVVSLWCLGCCVGKCFPTCLEGAFQKDQEWYQETEAVLSQTEQINKAAAYHEWVVNSNTVCCQGCLKEIPGGGQETSGRCWGSKWTVAARSTQSRFNFTLALMYIAALQFTHGALVEQHASFSGNELCEPGSGFACFEIDRVAAFSGNIFDFDPPAANCTHGYAFGGSKYMSCFRMHQGSLYQVFEALGSATGTVALLWAVERYCTKLLGTLTWGKSVIGRVLKVSSALTFIGIVVAASTGKIIVATVDFVGYVALLSVVMSMGREMKTRSRMISFSSEMKNVMRARQERLTKVNVVFTPGVQFNDTSQA